MPVFVAVVRRTTMSGPTAQQPPLQVGVADFQFRRDTGVLWVQPSILEASLAADVLIGLSTVLLTPGQSYEHRELVQFPAEQPALFRVLRADPDTGTLGLVYEGRFYDLPSGRTLEFEQAVAGAGTPAVVTIIFNHGRLAAILTSPPDGSVR